MQCALELFKIQFKVQNTVQDYRRRRARSSGRLEQVGGKWMVKGRDGHAAMPVSRSLGVGNLLDGMQRESQAAVGGGYSERRHSQNHQTYLNQDGTLRYHAAAGERALLCHLAIDDPSCSETNYAN